MAIEDDKYIKISFTGDVMCEQPLLRAARRGARYCFDEVFYKVKPLFSSSDYVVGNLETICTGEKNGLTNHIYSFNSPVEFLSAVKKSGIQLVTTATNHALDRGVKGLVDNLDEIKRLGLDSVGTYKNEEERKRIFVKSLYGVDVAFLNYTFGTNCHINGNKLNPEQSFHVNLLKSQEKEYIDFLYKEKSRNLKSILARLVFRFVSLGSWIGLKRRLGLVYNKGYQDNDLSELSDHHLAKIKAELLAAKKISDLVVVCAHMGGQFNSEPGKFSSYMMEFFDKNGADAVVANHPHVVQKAVHLTSGGLGAYCLGNFSISPSSVYVLHEDLPEYSILLHSYIDKKTKKIIKNTFSILKIEEESGGLLAVWPLYDLYETVSLERQRCLKIDALKVYNRFLNAGVKDLSIEPEYVVPLKEKG